MEFEEFLNKIEEEYSYHQDKDVKVLAKYGENGGAKLAMNVIGVAWDEDKSAIIILVF